MKWCGLPRGKLSPTSSRTLPQQTSHKLEPFVNIDLSTLKTPSCPLLAVYQPSRTELLSEACLLNNHRVSMYYSHNFIFTISLPTWIKKPVAPYCIAACEYGNKWLWWVRLGALTTCTATLTVAALQSLYPSTRHAPSHTQ